VSGERSRLRIQVTGLVQGVGFRPYVYRLATRMGLSGWVMNSPAGVVIEVEGPRSAVRAFARELERRPPPLARVLACETREIPPVGEGSFTIVASRGEGARETLVSPDVATCEACRREVFDPLDRRHLYPFTNCTDCGPRYTIIRDLPYDRLLTSMAAFEMCPECRREYEDPGDRRFHAQPNACPACGPRVWLEDVRGRKLAVSSGAGDGRWAELFREKVKEGAVVAVKGLGGFHLACDARSEEAVSLLRRRKRRPAKPFAVMAPHLKAARKYVEVGPVAEELLVSPAAPIVILPVRRERGRGGDRRERAAGPAPSVAPGAATLGVMLAYTPLHLMLFDEELDLLVMTSANPSGLPIIRDDDEARTRLAGTADLFLFHDRPIVNRCEDSVIRVWADGLRGPDGDRCGSDHAARCGLRDRPRGAGRGRPEGPAGGGLPVVIPYRRSRGYAPAPLEVAPSLPEPPPDAGLSVFGAGGEMKSTFCLLRGDKAFMSPHLGEMEFVESLGSYRETYERFQAFLDSPPKVVAVDPHPGYRVSGLAVELAGPEAARVGVFHHHAHMVSCLAENGAAGDAEVLGLVCDGTGYGPDGSIWGFEVLAGTAAGFRRLGCLAPTLMPGGDAAARRPFRAAAAHLHRTLGSDGVDRLARLYPDRREELEAVRAVLEAGLRGRSGGRSSPVPGAVLTSSCGRLFDAVSAMLGVTVENTYEGQAAVELSALCEDDPSAVLGPVPRRYRFRVVLRGKEAADPGGRAERADRAGRTGRDLAETEHGRTPGPEGGPSLLVLDPAPFLVALLEDVEAGRVDARAGSRLFHSSLVEAMVEALETASRLSGLTRVCLSGGTFQNPVLVRAVRRRLEDFGFEVLAHRRVPPNDGGLALGQAVAAAWMAREEGVI